MGDSRARAISRTLRSYSTLSIGRPLAHVVLRAARKGARQCLSYLGGEHSLLECQTDPNGVSALPIACPPLAFEVSSQPERHAPDDQHHVTAGCHPRDEWAGLTYEHSSHPRQRTYEGLSHFWPGQVA